MSDELLSSQTTAEPVSDAAPESSQPSAPGAAPAQQSPQSQDVWGAFRSLPDFEGRSDREIAGRLYAAMQREQAATQALRQYQQVIPYANEYAQYKDQFQQWRAEQAKAAQAAAQPQKEPHWNPPKIQDSWRRYLIRDPETGREVIDPNAPMHVRGPLVEYQEYRADFARKFLSNPEDAIGPMIEDRARTVAAEIVEEQLREASEAAFIDGLEQQHRSWMYNPDGSASEEGQWLASYISEAKKIGIQGAQNRWRYAEDKLKLTLLQKIRERDAAAPAPQAPPPPAPPAAAPAGDAPAENRDERDMNYLRREASRTPNRGAAATDPRVPKAPQTFEQRLRAQLAKTGLT